MYNIYTWWLTNDFITPPQLIDRLCKWLQYPYEATLITSTNNNKNN